MLKTIIILIFLKLSIYACAVYTTEVPIADISVNIDANKDKTTFKITWKFRQDLLQGHDKNKNGKFDKNEQEEIQDEYIKHLEQNNYITEIVYVQKGQRVKRSLINKINLKDSKLTFSKMDVRYTYEFDTSFVISKNHRLFIRFMDPQEITYVELKDITLNNYNGKKVIVPQKIRANIYFYEHKKKYKNLKDTILKR